jgi:hypothetical protein
MANLRRGVKTDTASVSWQEHLSLIDVEADADDGFDDLLEAVEPTASPEERAAVQSALKEMAIEAGEDVDETSHRALPVSASLRRVPTTSGVFQRGGSIPAKKAAATNWDSEFKNAQAHARDVLAKLGR